MRCMSPVSSDQFRASASTYSSNPCIKAEAKVAPAPRPTDNRRIGARSALAPRAKLVEIRSRGIAVDLSSVRFQAGTNGVSASGQSAPSAMSRHKSGVSLELCGKCERSSPEAISRHSNTAPNAAAEMELALPCVTALDRDIGRTACATGKPTMSNPVMSATRVIPNLARRGLSRFRNSSAGRACATSSSSTPLNTAGSM